MILQSLVDFYDLLAREGKISKPGYSMANVSYALNITKQGQLIGIIPLKASVTRGKKSYDVPQTLEVPEQVKRAVDINPNFLCDNSSYVLGADKKGKPERTRLCFEAFKQLHHRILDNVDTDQAKSVLAFLDDWQPEYLYTNVAIKDHPDEVTSGANIVFFIEGIGYAHECNEIKAAWEDYKGSNNSTVNMPCLVTGKVRPIARLHPSVRGVKGAQSAGASIVSFNAKAYESYGRDDQQGLNAPVSEYAAFAYTTILNYLISNDSHRKTYSDTTIVYWAKSSKPIYTDIFAYALDPVEPTGEQEEDKKSENIVDAVFKKIVEGKPIDDSVIEFDGDTHFYILGLAPNAARLSIRFFLEDTFGNILNNIKTHYNDLNIERATSDFEYIPMWRILLETVSPNSKDKSASPLLSGSLLRSVFSGQKYPEALYTNILLRIRAERNINRNKTAIIKAFLTRNRKGKYEEELTVSLNEQSQNKAYILGRLFAALEKAQIDANPGINTTIKDRYFTSACATPANVFPILLRLSQHHISKSEYGNISDRRISDLMEKLDVSNNPFPSHLSLDEQGLFILGYYHQQKANYTKREKEEK